IVDRDHAYTRIAPPMLNRFEKQILLRKDLLSNSQREIVTKLQQWCNNYCTRSMEKTFAGYHPDYLSSLVLAITSEYSEDKYSKEELLEYATNALIWVSTADGVLRSKAKQGNKYIDIYLHKQEHTDLPSFLEYVMEKKGDKFLTDNGFKLGVITYSPSSIYIQDLIEKVEKKYFSETRIEFMHDQNSEKEFSR